MMLGAHSPFSSPWEGCSCPVSAPYHHGHLISPTPFLSNIHCYHCGITDWTWLGPAFAVSSEKNGNTSGLMGIFHQGLDWFLSDPSSSASDLNPAFSSSHAHPGLLILVVCP